LVFTGVSRTAEIDAGKKEIHVESSDFCNYYQKHPYTFLWKKECWTCKYADFGIEEGDPAEVGICRYKSIEG